MIKAAAAHELHIVEGIMEKIHREEPSYWPFGLSTSQFNGGLYLVKESSTASPVGFVGWQQFPENGKNVGYYAVGILPQYRERGFAKSAVAQVIREVRRHCDDVKAYIMRHNTPSKALARSLNVSVVEKSANTKQEAIAGLIGALGSTVFFDQAADTERSVGSSFQPWKWDKERALMGGLNAILGAGGGAAMAKGNTLTGAGILALAPTKDLAMKGIGSLYHVDQAAREAAKSFAHERSRPDPAPVKNVIESIPKGVWLGAGGLGLGALGLAILNAKKKRDLEKRKLDQEAAGVARVTLPTAQPGDLETQIQLPVGDLHLSNAILQNLGRDTRRRLRTETRQRTIRRGERKKTEPEKSASVKLQELVGELDKYAMAGAPAPAGNVPVPPQLGQNPALRMQNQQQATANSITPPPAANPAVMQAEQKAMETEQTAMQQQAQSEQASQQAQMEMEQRFQQELSKNEQEKEILKLQLEKEKAMASLQKEQSKAEVALNKAQADGAASASEGENSVAGRLIANRLDRLQKRVGSIKAASQGTMDMNGQTYVTGTPPPAPTAPQPVLPPPAANQMDVAGNRYNTGTAGVPGSIDPATGGKIPEPFKHLKPEAPQRINKNPGSNAMFPSVGIYRTSYGPLLDTAFDWTLKKLLTTPKPQQTRFVRQADLTNAPDKMGVIRQLYSNAITTNPMLANA